MPVLPACCFGRRRGRMLVARSRPAYLEADRVRPPGMAADAVAVGPLEQLAGAVHDLHADDPALTDPQGAGVDGGDGKGRVGGVEVGPPQRAAVVAGDVEEIGAANLLILDHV